MELNDQISAWYTRWYPKQLARSQAKLRSRADAEDATQEGVRVVLEKLAAGSITPAAFENSRYAARVLTFVLLNALPTSGRVMVDIDDVDLADLWLFADLEEALDAHSIVARADQHLPHEMQMVRNHVALGATAAAANHGVSRATWYRRILGPAVERRRDFIGEA